MKLAELKLRIRDGTVHEETIEYRRQLYLEYIYQSGRIKE